MAWELNFMKWGAAWWTLPFLDRVLPWVTHLGSHFAVILFIILSWVFTKQRYVLRGLLLVYGIQSAIVYGLKYLIQRPRPLFSLETVSRLSGSPGEILDPSFPSAHTVYAFMMATFLSHWFPRYRAILFIVAGLIGWTRIYLGLHYPTDIIAGILLGYGISTYLLRFQRF